MQIRGYIAGMTRVDRYSRMVMWLKVTLPLAALAILSTLFLVAETLDPEAAIPYADVDVGQILEDQGVNNAVFGGLTDDGVEVSVDSESVRPDGPLFLGKKLDVEMLFPDGSRVYVDAPEGTVHMANSEALLSGGVQINSTLGYEMVTEALRTTWDTTTLESAGPVSAKGPLGDIDAGHMRLSQKADGAYLLVFKDGVRLIYQPEP